MNVIVQHSQRVPNAINEEHTNVVFVNVRKVFLDRFVNVMLHWFQEMTHLVVLIQVIQKQSVMEKENVFVDSVNVPLYRYGVIAVVVVVVVKLYFIAPLLYSTLLSNKRPSNALQNKRRHYRDKRQKYTL